MPPRPWHPTPPTMTSCSDRPPSRST
jgi:hypothetical protein